MADADPQVLRDELRRYRDKVDVPAVIGAVTGPDGLLGVDVVGSRSRTRPDEAATVDDLWHIGSCGKSMTAVLWARLVEAGVSDWGVPVRDLFGHLDDVDAGWGDPTIDDVLHCRAGVQANPSIGDMRRSLKTSASPQEQRHEAAAKVLATPPKRPGKFVYSNLGYTLVGAAIDHLCGRPYEDAMANYVWEPLGITTAATGAPPRILGHAPRLRLGSLVAGKGTPRDPATGTQADNPPLLTPAGRWHLSVQDWAAFLRVFLNDGAPLLTPASIAHLLAHPGGDHDSMAMGWASGKPLGASYAMQGSNTMWAATAALDMENRRAAMVIANDGRTKVLMTSSQLARQLLDLYRG